MTTHSMAEAEVLCSRLCIISKGQLKCIGEQQHLKSRFGQGFKLDILSDVVQKSKAHSFVMKLIPTAKIVTSNNAYMAFQIPKSVKLSSLFTKIETQKSQNGIVSWGISQSNLEEVFLTIVKQDNLSQASATIENKEEQIV